MNDKASTAVDEVASPQIQKEAVDALAQLKGAEQSEVFGYFQSLLEFQKQAADAKQRAK